MNGQIWALIGKILVYACTAESVGFFLVMGAWRFLVPRRLKVWCSLHAEWLWFVGGVLFIPVGYFGWGVGIFSLWGERAPRAYILCLAAIAVLDILLTLAGLWYRNDLFVVGLLLIFWFVILLIGDQQRRNMRKVVTR